MYRILPALLAFAFIASQADATPLNRWSVSCEVDKGSIVRKQRTWVFQSSVNQCPGGFFNQRAEINTQKIPSSRKGKYQFSTTVRMVNERNEQFDIFQIHDGRDGCAPPLKVIILPSGQIKLYADYKTGPGESCVRDVLRHKPSSVRFKRDGTPQDLKIIVNFLGDAHFDVQVMLDGRLAAQGNYDPPKASGFVPSKHYYFKHGVYSKNMFKYQLISKNMFVKHLRN